MIIGVLKNNKVDTSIEVQISEVNKINSNVSTFKLATKSGKPIANFKHWY